MSETGKAPPPIDIFRISSSGEEKAPPPKDIFGKKASDSSGKILEFDLRKRRGGLEQQSVVTRLREKVTRLISSLNPLGR